MMASGHDADASMTVRALMRRPTGYLPVAMPLGALAMIVWYVAMHGFVHQSDEGAQAHLWPLLVAGQVPLIAYFAFRWLPRARRSALMVLALQAASVMSLAVAPLWALGGL
jgi:FtsH-binding integral membrane protein